MKTFKALTLSAFLAGAALMPVAAHAEGDHANVGNATRASGEAAISSQTFSKLDIDSSGTLSESEYSNDKTASVNFDRADANGDGTLTLAEAQTLNAAAKAKPVPMAD